MRIKDSIEVLSVFCLGLAMRGRSCLLRCFALFIGNERNVALLAKAGTIGVLCFTRAASDLYLLAAVRVQANY